MLQRLTIGLAVTLLLLLGGCTTPYSPPVVVKGAPDFQGIVDQLDPAAPLDVVLVHGMCTKTKKWADAAMDEILQAIDSNIKSSRQEPSVAKAIEAPKIEVFQREAATARGTVRFTALVWSGLTQPLKDQLKFDLTGTPTDCATADECKPQRAKLNAIVKDELLNDCLADALAYEGASRPFIRRAMVSALSQVLAEGNPGRPLVLVSDSLGSKIVFDALADMLDRSSLASIQAVGKSGASRMGLVFMNANQLPILGLSDQDVSQLPSDRTDLKAAPTEPLQRYLSARRQQGLSALTVVAFTDPNDLLSYRLLPSRYAGEDVLIADVLVSNSSTFLGLVQLPTTAHTGYTSNPGVARFIACGREKTGKNPRCK